MQDLRNIHIVIVEDDPTMAKETIPDAFQFYWPEAKERFKFQTFMTSQEALASLAKMAGEEEAGVDILVLDVSIPERGGQDPIEREGLSVARVVQDYRILSQSSIVAVFTAHFNWDQMAIAIKYGADVYLPKRMLNMEEWIADEEKIEKISAFEVLVTSCRYLFEVRDGSSVSLPPKDWIVRNRRWLEEEYYGKWVALVPKERAVDSEGFVEREGLIVVTGSTLGDVREAVVNNGFIRKGSAPGILLVSNSDF